MDAQARADRYDSIQQDPTAHIQDDDEVVSRVTLTVTGPSRKRYLRR